MINMAKNDDLSWSVMMYHAPIQRGGFVVENSSRRYLACDAISFNYTLTKWSLYVFVDPLQDSSAWTQGRIGREDKTIQRTRKWLQKYRKWKVNFTSKISFSHVFNIVRFCISLKKKKARGTIPKMTGQKNKYYWDTQLAMNVT